MILFLFADSLAGICEAAGIQDVCWYPYWDMEQRGVGVQKMMVDLEMAPEQSVIVLSASSHCPTGSDLSQKHWRLSPHRVYGGYCSITQMFLQSLVMMAVINVFFLFSLEVVVLVVLFSLLVLSFSSSL